MMLGCDDDKPHAGILAKGDPFCTLGFVPDATAPSIRPQWMNKPLLS
jgi:hypothetical protein